MGFRSPEPRDRLRVRERSRARGSEQTATGDRNVSPQLDLVYALGKASTLRAAWGHYCQSQRVYELQVEDGDTELARAELTEAVLVGFEHVFRGGPTLRVNAYRRDVSRPRHRYENVFEPISTFPEVEPDRVLIAPDHARSRGVEVFLRGRAGRLLDWWASWAWARAEDEIHGRHVPRGIDQPHTVNLDLSFRATPHWTFNDVRGDADRLGGTARRHRVNCMRVGRDPTAGHRCCRRGRRRN